MTYREIFAQRLDALIRDNFKSKVEFAEKIQIPRTTINNYILNKREATLENLCKIANFFDVDLDYLCGRKEY